MACCDYTYFFFFFNDTATTEIYTLSLHDALPISASGWCFRTTGSSPIAPCSTTSDRKSTRLNSSHSQISYAVFCLKKKIRPDGTAATFFTTSPVQFSSPFYNFCYLQYKSLHATCV